MCVCVGGGGGVGGKLWRFSNALYPTFQCDVPQVQLTYSTTSGQNYAFSVNFPTWCGLDCDDCSVDITDENIVVVLAKNDESSGKEWQDFTVGFKGAQPSVSFVNHNTYLVLHSHVQESSDLSGPN